MGVEPVVKASPPEGVIWKSDLLQRLVRAAQLRSAITMVLGVVVLVFAALFMPNSALSVFAVCAVYFFGICSILTWVLCKPMVKCPHCGRSLWKLGTGNFKPRRMRIRSGATGCSGCGARLV